MLAWKTSVGKHRRRTCRCSHQLGGPIREEANTKQTTGAKDLTKCERFGMFMI